MIQFFDQYPQKRDPTQGVSKMTTTARGSDDDFDRVEQGIDWLERLEVIKARHDRESAAHETVEYVSRLRAAILTFAGDSNADQLSALYGSEVASLVESVMESDTTDPWTEYLQPALLEN